ncbi:MAG: hypothetical protein QXT26_05875 [Thermoproteota archaeon]
MEQAILLVTIFVLAFLVPELATTSIAMITLAGATLLTYLKSQEKGYANP